jgi:hypothetical protein
MSGLRSDSILYEGESYVILGSNPYDGLFDPQQFGITPDSYSSSPRALACAYSVTDGTLLLSSLEIGSKGGVYPLINEIRPCFSHNLEDGAEEEVPEFYYQAVETRDARGKIAWRVDAEALYKAIDMPMTYTGTLRIGHDPDVKYYLGFFLSGWPDWMHRKVLDLKFLDGRLESVTDLSDEMAKIREQQPTAEEYHASNSGYAPPNDSPSE